MNIMCNGVEHDNGVSARALGEEIKTFAIIRRDVARIISGGRHQAWKIQRAGEMAAGASVIGLASLTETNQSRCLATI